MSEQAEVINVNACLLEDGAKVKRGSDELWTAMLAFDGGRDKDGQVVKGLRNEYQDIYDRELIAYEEEVIGSGNKLPAADGRAARVRVRVEKLNPELVANYRAREAQIASLKQMIANRKASIGAWQSILRGERD